MPPSLFIYVHHRHKHTWESVNEELLIRSTLLPSWLQCLQPRTIAACCCGVYLGLCFAHDNCAFWVWKEIKMPLLAMEIKMQIYSMSTTCIQWLNMMYGCREIKYSKFRMFKLLTAHLLCTWNLIKYCLIWIILINFNCCFPAIISKPEPCKDISDVRLFYCRFKISDYKLHIQPPITMNKPQ